VSGQAYRGPNRGAAGCGRDLAALAVSLAALMVLAICVGFVLGWWY
jgi:hypothetical protein